MFSSSSFKVSGLKLRFLICFSVDFCRGEVWGSGSSPDTDIQFPVPFVKEALSPGCAVSSVWWLWLWVCFWGQASTLTHHSVFSPGLEGEGVGRLTCRDAMSNMYCVSYAYLPLSFQGRTYNLLSPKNYSEVCKNCNDAYKNLSTLYNELQKMNGLENKAEPGTHLCIDVEDAVSTSSGMAHGLQLLGALSVSCLFAGALEYSRHLHPEGTAVVTE